MSRTETPSLEDSIDIIKLLRNKKIKELNKGIQFKELDNDKKIEHIKELILIATEDPSIEKRKNNKKGARRSIQDEEDTDIESVVQSISTAMYFENSPPYIKNGQLKPFQIDALNWLIRRHHLGVNSILADEMGLGKTLESISLLGYLYHVQDCHGPHIVISPKSTIDNWKNEINKWLPSIKVALMGGTRESREDCRKENFDKDKLKADVIICSYQVISKEKSLLKKQKFVYLILDEAHSAKNENTRFYNDLSEINATHKLFLTGTPLQNTLHELWSLLQFLLPEIFNTKELDEIFESIESDKFQGYIDSIRDFIKPFMLRRLKTDVQKELPPKMEIKIFVQLTPFQKIWYRKVLMGDVTVIIGDKIVKSKLNNTMTQLRKVCDHPYLMPGAEPEPYVNGEHLCLSSAKMIVMEKLVEKHLKNNGKILIFSQMTRMLDIIDDYLVFKDIEHYRIDGQTQQEDRVEQIKDFNDPNGKVSIFLLSTRSGGLGINLQSADTVILYDSDWNPQSDIQAMDRAHRIGQTKPVTVYRLICEGTAEQRLIRVAERKLMLNRLVMQSGKTATEPAIGKEELLQIMQQELTGCLKEESDDKKVKENNKDLKDIDIESIIQSGKEKTQELKNEIEKETETAKKGMMNLTNFAFGVEKVDIREFEGRVFGQNDNLEDLERYKENMKLVRTETLKQPPAIKFRDLQFPSKELLQLLDKENEEYKRLNATFKEDLTFAILKGDSLDPILHPKYLSDEDNQRKEKLLKETFYDWDDNDFRKWKTAMKKYGYERLDEISTYMGKDKQEVQRYNDVFIQRYNEVNEGEKLYNSLFKSEQKRKLREKEQEDLAQAIKAKPDDMTVLTPYVYFGNSQTDPLVDSMMLRKYAEYGEDWERILKEIKEHPLFVFNIYINSYTPQTVKEKIRFLIHNVEKTKEKMTKENDGNTILDKIEINDNFENKKMRKEDDNID
ncbi:hypothetical protein ENUP19_0340G0058 [Entamoeba nuttalli]|uniref:Helicase, putative n=2 Tax=Entamoeba nuttalli TaxID=412467 RepID=K2H406_ENTNP|nr:helicase, putative [Entamoeba nuttalli P19]EKE42248.1 helicase, putative [Entamoeba nuttalli P19]|eukprot:XP_008855419.1 helicase, putative [Entamoeba nuttalli P19]